MARTTTPAVGETAPDFELPGPDGPVKLSSYRGSKTVVLYFYPADNTVGCTVEACSFRDSYEDFKDAGAEVVGVSADSQASHKGFADKHRLPFLLLSDPGGEVHARYGVNKLLGVLADRVTLVIDRAGVVRYVFQSRLRFKAHVTSALEIVRSLEPGPRAGAPTAAG